MFTRPAQHTTRHVPAKRPHAQRPPPTADRQPPTTDDDDDGTSRRRRAVTLLHNERNDSTTCRRARAHDNHAAAQPHNRASRSARCTATQTTARLPSTNTSSAHFVATALCRAGHIRCAVSALATGMTTIVRQTCAIGTLHSSTAAGTSSPRKRPPCDTEQTPPPPVGQAKRPPRKVSAFLRYRLRPTPPLPSPWPFSCAERTTVPNTRAWVFTRAAQHTTRHVQAKRPHAQRPQPTTDRRPPTTTMTGTSSSSSCCHYTTNAATAPAVDARARVDSPTTTQPRSRASRCVRCTATQTTARLPSTKTLRRDGTPSALCHVIYMRRTPPPHPQV